MEEVEELLTLHSFVKSASKRGGNLGQTQSFFEQECLISLHNMGNDNINDLFLFDSRNPNQRLKNQNQPSNNGKRQNGRQVMRGNNDQYNQHSQSQLSKKDLDAQLLLLSIEQVSVSKISCSNRHSLIVSLLPALF